MRALIFRLLLAVLAVSGTGYAAAAQAVTEPPFTLECRFETQAGNSKRQFCEVRELAMPAPVGQPLLIHGATGSTVVSGWDGPDVRIRVLVQSPGTTQEEAQARVRAVRITATGNTLRAVLPDLAIPRSVRYEVFVPRATALVVSSASGSLRFENLLGRLAFEGGNGTVTLTNLGGQVTGSVANGNIFVNLTGRTWVGEGLDVRATNGDVSWRMPADYSARLQMSTANGRFYTGLPVVKANGQQELDAAVGQGGPLLKASTLNGTIYFRGPNGETLYKHSAEAVSPAQSVGGLKRALAQADPAAADSLLAQARRLPYLPGQVVALAQLAARQQPQDPAAAAACLREATQLATQLRDVGDAGWALSQIGRLEGRLARQSPDLAGYYAPLRQALGEAMNASAAFQAAPAVPKEADVAAQVASAQRRLRGLDAALASVPLPPAVPGVPLGRLALAGLRPTTKWLDTLLAQQPASPQAARELTARRRQLARSQALSTAFAKEGNYAKAYQYYVQYSAYKDSLTAEATTRRLAALQYRQSLLQKEAQIQRLTKEQLLRQQAARRQQQSVLALAVCVAVLGLVAFVLSRSNRARREANAQLSEQKGALQQTLAELKTAQGQLIQSEKMASLGELTAGIAHEIQNPLNFVNNFAEVSTELVDELEEERARPTRDTTLEAELLTDLRQNLGRIHQHGHRASAIVKGMLEHARSSTGQHQPTDLNALLAEYGKLAYYSARAKDKAFEADLHLDLAPDLGLVAAAPQDISRVLLNIFTNAFYAVQEQARTAGPGYRPQVQVRTRRAGPQVSIQIQDNGPGIPASLRQKIFQPFFTTKPTGEGTGLGLSLAYDIVTKGHGGTLVLDSEEGRGTEFTIALPIAS